MKRRNAVAALVVIAALAVAGAQLLPDSSRPKWMVPATIDATGKTDVTAHLNNWLRKVPAGTTVVFPVKARYKAEGTVFLQFKQDVRIDGNGALIFAETDGSGFTPDPNAPWFNPRGWPGNRAHFLFYKDRDVAVSKLRIRGPNFPGGDGSYNPHLEGQAGIEISSCVRCEARDNYISHVYGDGAEIDFASSDIVVSGTTIAANGRQGITVVDTLRADLNHNTLSNIGRTVFDLEPEPEGYDHGITIADNTVTGPTGGIFVGAEGAGRTGSVHILRNKLVGIPLVVRDHNSGRPERRGKIEVVDNTTNYGFDNYPIGMMVFNGVDGVTVTGNHAVARPNEAVRTSDCTSVVITGNSWQH